LSFGTPVSLPIILALAGHIGVFAKKRASVAKKFALLKIRRGNRQKNQAPSKDGSLILRDR
jgi:hypothetical protein